MSISPALARFLDPLGTPTPGIPSIGQKAKQAGAGLATVWDPAGLFTGKSSSSTAAATPAIAPAATPITSASPEVLQTQEDYRRMMARKRGFNAAIFAGDTGGWTGQTNPTPSPMSRRTSTATGAATLGGT